MVDQKKAQNRIRKRINELVQQRINDAGCSEEEARKQIRDETKAKKKQRKMKPDDEIKKIEKDTRKSLAGSSDKKIQKAVAAAVAKYYSQLKKQKKDTIKNSGNKLIMKKIADKWCPRNESWFDEKCEKSYNSLYLLAAMLGQNLEKSTDMLEEQFPQECSKYFDMLAKKRFNSTEPAKPKAPATPTMLAPAYLEGKIEEVKKEEEAEKPVKAPTVHKRKITKIEKAFNAKLAANTDKKSEQELLKEVIKEAKMKSDREQIKITRKNWFPVNQAWFDQECKNYATKINAAADELGLDLKTNPADFKKLKDKSSKLTKGYFKLLQSKKLTHDRVAEKENKTLNKNKKKKKKKPAKEETEEVEEESRENKKIKFDENDDDEDDDNVDAEDLLEDMEVEEDNQEESSTKKKNKKKKKKKGNAPTTPEKSSEVTPKKSANSDKKKENKATPSKPGSEEKKSKSSKKNKENSSPVVNHSVKESAKKGKAKKKL